MRPISLQFSGIRSYRAPAVVDFTNLDLFAIIGDTGAGKSTILEALTFALYGRKTWSGGTLDELIADGERRMMAELTFEAADDVWTVTRTRNRSSTPGVNKLVNASGSVKVDNAGPVTEKVTELLGLKFEQFTSAVVMRQGRFDELLRASATERTHILTSILGLDDLKSVGNAADGLRRQWTDAVIGARRERDLLGHDPHAALAEATQRAGEADARHAALSASATAATEAADVQQRLGGATTALRTELERLAPIDAADVVERLERLAVLGRLLLDEHEAAQQAFTEAEQARADLGAEEADVLGGLADRDAVLRTGVDLGRTAERLADLHDQRASIQRALIERKASPPGADVDPARSAALQEAEAARDAAAKVAAERSTALETAEQRWDALILAGAEVARLEQDRAEARAAAGPAQALVERLQAALLASSSALTGAEAAREGALRANAAAAAAADRHPGDDCPVCAQPLPLTFVAPLAADLEAADAALRAARDDHRTAAEAVGEANRSLDRAAANVELLERANGEAASRLEQAEAAAGAAGLPRPPGSREEALSPFVADVEAAVAAKAEADAAVAAARAGLDEARSALARAQGRYEQDIQNLTKQAGDVEAALEAVHRSADALPSAWRPSSPVTEASLADAIARVGAAAARLAELAVQRQRAQDESGQATSRMQAVRTRNAEEVRQPAEVLLATVNARLDGAGYVSAGGRAAAGLLDDPPATVGEPPERITIEPKVVNLPMLADAARDRLGAAEAVERASRAVLAAADERRAGVERDLAEVLRGAGQADVAALLAAAGEASQRAATARQDVERAVANRDRSVRLDEVLAVGEPFIQNLDVIVAAMRPGAFVQHLLKSREMELLAEATRRLRAITNGRFGFVVDFGVVNTASGEVRSPDSLSGGERFQAALALALALVEIASRGAGRLDAVFVDEGFGSLDAGALDMALATLGSVAGGGRTVALISHLRPVAEYVETVLHVTRNDISGSRIERLGPDARDRLVADDIRSGLTA